MKQLRGTRNFFYVLSAAGYALILATLAAGGLAFYSPPLERLKDGLPRFLPSSDPGRLPLLWFAALTGLVAFIVAAPVAAYCADRSRSGVGGRRALLLAGLPLLALSCLLVFLPPVAGPSAVNVVLMLFFSLVAGTGAALSLAPYLSLGFEPLSTDAERTLRSTLQTACLFGGALLPAALLPGFFESFPGLDPAASFQWSLLPLILSAAALMSAAFFAAAEKRSGDGEPGARGVAPVLKAAFRSFRDVAAGKPFSRFLRAEAPASVALALLAIGAVPAARDLMLADGEFTRLTAIVFLAAGLASLPFIRPLAAKLGVKKLALAGLAAFAGGLLLLAFTGLVPGAGLRWNCATAVAQAPDGAVWIGTRRGASRFLAGGWSQVTRREGLIDDRINAMAADGDGVWFATSHGASLFDGKTWTHFSKASGLVDDRVLDVMKRGAAVWFLTPVGVSLLDNSEWRMFAPRRAGGKEPAAPLTAFALSPEGDLWLGTEKGAWRYSGGAWTEFTVNDGLRDDAITTIDFGPDGAVLLGTYRGVARRSGDAWSFLTKADGLPDEAVRAIRTAPDGRLFVATDRGLLIADAAGKRVLTHADGLAADRVDGILFARDGSIWFAGANGVSVFANGLWTRHQYPLPWIWGLVAAILLAFPAAVLLTLPRVFTAGAAEAARGKGDRNETLFFTATLSVKTAAFIAALLFGAGLLYGGGESVANPLPVRIVLLAAALATGASLFLHFRFPGPERGKK